MADKYAVKVAVHLLVTSTLFSIMMSGWKKLMQMVQKWFIWCDEIALYLLLSVVYCLLWAGNSVQKWLYKMCSASIFIVNIRTLLSVMSKGHFQKKGVFRRVISARIYKSSARTAIYAINLHGWHRPRPLLIGI